MKAEHKVFVAVMLGVFVMNTSTVNTLVAGILNPILAPLKLSYT